MVNYSYLEILVPARPALAPQVTMQRLSDSKVMMSYTLLVAILHKVSKRLALAPRVEIVPIILAHFLRITLDALAALEDAGLGGLHHHQGLVFVQA